MVVDLPESTWPMTTMLMWVFSFPMMKAFDPVRLNASERMRPFTFHSGGKLLRQLKKPGVISDEIQETID